MWSGTSRPSWKRSIPPLPIAAVALAPKNQSVIATMWLASSAMWPREYCL